MKAQDLRELTVEELKKKSQELRHEQLTIRMQMVTGQAENPARLRILRKEVARVETILSERRKKAEAAKAGAAK